MSENKIIFDVETQKTFSEVGGLQSNHHLLGVSFVGVYSYKQNKYFGFLEKDLNILEAILLKEKPMLIGFNNKGFDNKVLQPYFKKINLDNFEYLDILEEIYKKLGFRLKLESVAQASIGDGKSGTGLDAIRYYREKDFDALAKYCLDDVRITKEVYEYGQQQGCLYYIGGGEKRKIEINWGDSPTICEAIQQAFAKHLRLDIKFYTLNEKQKREILTELADILVINNDKVTLFIPNKSKKMEIVISQIIKAVGNGESYAHQTSLL